MRNNQISGMSIRILSLVFVLLLSIFSFGNEGKEHTEELHKEESMMDVINHHIGDSHEFEVYHNKAGTQLVIPLPVIIYSTTKGFTTVLSSDFHHGEVSVNGYKLIHHAGEIVNKSGDHAVSLGSLFGSHDSGEMFFDFSITKNVFAMLLSVLLLLLLFVPVARKYKKTNGEAPSGVQNLMEVLIEFVRNDIVEPNLGAKKTPVFMPYLLTVFFFIWINNMLGLIPFFPGSANVTGNISFTVVMALITFFVTNLSGNKDYWGHVLWMPGVPLLLKPFMALVEIIGLFTKPFALTVRLFANITAGHIIILALVLSLGVLSAPLGLFMNVLELLVAFLQAYVFTMLSALFIGQAVAEHEHH